MRGMFSFFNGRVRYFDQDLSPWRVDACTSMTDMFMGCAAFNADLSPWKVSQVKSMHQMFAGCASFTHQLGGEWTTTAARKKFMFQRSPGSIVGKTKNALGTIE